MNVRWVPALYACLCLMQPALPVAAEGPGDAGLEQVLTQLENTGKTFKNFRAKFSQRKYTLVLEEFDAPEAGTFIYARAKDGSALLRQEVITPAPRVLTIKGGVATIFQPQLNQGQQVFLGKNKDKAEYLALGLGQSPGKLRETFELKYQGEEKVNGLACSVVNMKPKSPSAAAYFSSITLWINKTNGVPIQQKLLEPNGDYLLVTFSEERLNTKVPDSLFDQKLPSGADVQVIR